LVFNNCYLYNNAQDPVSLDAKKLEDVFQKWLKKRPEPQPVSNEKKKNTQILTLFYFVLALFFIIIS
jgi:hypothetical protein